MIVKDLMRHLAEAVDTWPEIADMPITFEGKSFDMLIPCNPEGMGPVTDAGAPVGGIDICDSGLRAEDYDRHMN